MTADHRPAMSAHGPGTAAESGGPAAADFGDWRAEYGRLTGASALVDVSSRTQIELAGADRAVFLQRLCTNDLRKLVPGAGCEIFFTNVQGKVLGHGFVFCTPDSLVVETVPDQEHNLLQHLDRYLIRENVVLTPRTQDWAELFLAGPAAPAVLTQAGLPVPAGRLQHENGNSPRPVAVRRVELTGPNGFLLSCGRPDLPDLREALLGRGAAPCGWRAFEAARIEAGTPFFGQDISDDHLPQEVARDALAISFTKGCYLGQETVARIDALGHVNKTLCGVRFQAMPGPGAELSAAGKPAGIVASVAESPKLGGPLALAYVRRGHHAPGTRLESASGVAEVVQLPL